MRMAKVGSHTAVILEVGPDGRSFREYDPFEPEDAWEGTLSWRSDSRVVVEVGPYVLDAAAPQSSSLRFFQGTETGPSGDHDMDLFVLSDDPDRLWDLPGTAWLAIRTGSWTPVRRTPTGSGPFERLPERRVGSAVGRFPSMGSDQPIASFDGIYGGRRMDLRVRRLPSRTDAAARLEADVDSQERFTKWSWNDSGGFLPDREHVRLTGRSCLLYPIESCTAS